MKELEKVIGEIEKLDKRMGQMGKKRKLYYPVRTSFSIDVHMKFTSTDHQT